jgi:hypothetical protein
MNRRTMMLILGAAAVALFYFIDQAYTSLIEQPTTQLETQIDAARRSLSDANAEQVAGRRLANKLDDYAGRALPHDPALAKAVYQKWLLELVERHQMKSASINAEQPQTIEVRGRINRRQRRQVGHTIRFTIRARTSLPLLTDFMLEFQNSAHLHKIRSFTINPLGNGSELDLTLVAETLALQATERVDTLSDWVRTDEAIPRRSDYDVLVSRNLFARGFSQTLAQIRLGAITRGRSGNDEAWFRVGAPAKTQIVNAGGVLRLPLHSVEIRTIEPDRVLVSVNDQTGWLQLGQSLGQLFGIDPATAQASTADPSTADPSKTEADVVSASDTTPPTAENVTPIDGDRSADDESDPLNTSSESTP